MLASFARRRLEGELMDDPALPRPAHDAALNGLRRINLASRTAAALWPPIARISRTRDEPMRLLDVACGGGDVAIALSQRARREGMALAVSGCDVSEAALDHAAARAKSANSPVRLFKMNALEDPLPRRYDIVVTTLFLHHLTDADIVKLLQKLATHCDHLLASDLVRGPLGYGLAWAGTHLLSTSKIVHADGLRSVRAALSLDEAKSLAAYAGLADAHFERHWPQRFLMYWQRAETCSGVTQA